MATSKKIMERQCKGTALDKCRNRIRVDRAKPWKPMAKPCEEPGKTMAAWESPCNKQDNRAQNLGKTMGQPSETIPEPLDQLPQPGPISLKRVGKNPL